MMLRPATEDDAPQIAALHIASWRATYVNELSQALRDGQDPAIRTSEWRARIAGGQHVLVADDGSRVVGFVACGPARDVPTPDEAWEIYNLHTAPDRHGRGVGSRLFAAAIALGRERGAQRVVLWVVETNDSACAFYEHRGMRADGGEQEHAVGLETLHEVRYALTL